MVSRFKIQHLLDPFTLGILGAGVSAAGSIVGGISSSNAAKYQAQVAENNALIERQNADYAMKAGEAQTEKSSLRGAANLAAIKASQAANGVDVNTGSNLDVQESARETNKLDTLTTLNNAQLQAYGYRTQATAFESQAQLDKSAANSDLIGGFLGVGGSLLGNASGLNFKWGSPDVYSSSETPVPSEGLF